MKKIIFAIFALLASVSLISFASQPAYAANICENTGSPWGITRWCAGLPEDPDFKSGREAILNYIVILVSNIAAMLMDVGAYVAVVLVMWGGFLFITSAGDPAKTVKGKKTITNSLIGIVIMKIASVICDFVREVSLGIRGTENNGMDGLASYIAGKILFWAGMISVLMLVYSGYQYSSSVGNPAATAKAKQNIIFSLVGLGIVMLAAVIVNVVIKTFA